MHKSQPAISIVIISMNNPGDLDVCLNSLLNSGIVSVYEIIVIAYAYTDENLKLLTDKYRDLVVFVRTEMIKGFAENNNIGLKLAKGKYCMILNDDTYFVDNSVQRLINTMDADPSIKLLSPHILNFDGSSQILGWPKYDLLQYFKHELKVGRSSYVGESESDFFQTFSISGACFVIDLETFKDIGYFDEKYFFTPEDMAVAASLASKGIFPYVDKKAVVYHKGSSTAKKIHQVTIPVAKQGIYLYFREFYGLGQELIVRLFIISLSTFKLAYWLLKSGDPRKSIMIKANVYCIKYAFTNIMPKTLFIKLYNENILKK